MTDHITSEKRLELQRIWDALLRQALSKGVPFQDAEDIVSNSLRNGLEHYDGTRGELLPFCRTILSNAIKNHWRDRKIDLPIDEEEFRQADEGPDGILEEKERAESMRRTVEQLSSLLSKEELAFMTMLGQVVEELGDRAVSETARRLGLKPTRGWDLFRRIQRKAQSLEAPPVPEMRAKLKRPATTKEKSPDRNIPPIDSSAVRSSSEHLGELNAPAPMLIGGLYSAVVPGKIFSIAGAMAREEGFERFIKTL
jgi:DNA-directed RNA polymerase specialized sigma24 family protein